MKLPFGLHPLMRGVMDAGALGAYPLVLQQARGAVNRPVERYGQRYNSPEVKSTGFFGVIHDSAGHPMSEYSFGGDAGVPQHPSMVPGLTGRQLQNLADHAGGRTRTIYPVTEEMAWNHARSRIDAGLPTFWRSE